MTIQEIYDEYKIPPFLQMHQYRVAGVAKMLFTYGMDKADENQMIKTCLLHDMGNIIKFDMDMFYNSWDPEGTAYWGEVKDDFKRRYGGDEMKATLKIIDEILPGNELRDTVRISGFNSAATALSDMNWPSMILIYCDMRAKPDSITDLGDRLKDLQERYKYNMSSTLPKDPKEFQINKKALDKIESLIFKQVKKLRTKHISEEAVQELIPDLKKYVIN